MLKACGTCVRGRTNLQAIMDSIDDGRITNAKIQVVISNNAGGLCSDTGGKLRREALLLSPKSFDTREEFNQKLLEVLKERDIDLVVLPAIWWWFRLA